MATDIVDNIENIKVIKIEFLYSTDLVWYFSLVWRNIADETPRPEDPDDAYIWEKRHEYEEYFDEYGVGFNEVELLMWCYLDTEDTSFLDKIDEIDDDTNSPFLKAAIETAIDIYYADDPGQKAREISSYLFMSGMVVINLAPTIYKKVNSAMDKLFLNSGNNSRNNKRMHIIIGFGYRRKKITAVTSAV